MDTETAYDYWFEFESEEGETHRLGLKTHWDNSIGEPRIRWRTEDGSASGEWGSLKYPDDLSRSSQTPMMTIEVAEPTLVFGRFEDSPRFGVPETPYSSASCPVLLIA